jgi:hypothetical protein
VTWEEINWGTLTWEIRGPRMKNRAPHNVPLSGRMVEILKEQQARRPEGHPFLFPGRKAKWPLDSSAAPDFLKRVTAGNGSWRLFPDRLKYGLLSPLRPRPQGQMAVRRLHRNITDAACAFTSLRFCVRAPGLINLRSIPQG